MPLSNKDYYAHVMEQYKKNANRLIRATTNATKEMEKLEKLELEIIKDCNKFADVIELIQNRPVFKEIAIDKVSIPELDTKELTIQSKNASKLLSKYNTPQIGISGLLITPEIKKQGIFGHDIPFLDGTVLGVEAQMAIDKISGLGVFQVLGSKESDKIYQIAKEVDKIEERINSIIPTLDRMKKCANSYHNSIKYVRDVYLKEFEIMQKATETTTDYCEFLKSEKKAMQNSVLLVGLLYQMCKVKLLKTSDMEVENIEINSEIEEKIDNSMIVMSKVDLSSGCVANPVFTDSQDENSDEIREYVFAPVSSECADAVNVHARYAEYSESIIYLNDDKKLIQVNKDNGLETELDLGIDISSITKYDLAGHDDYLFIVIQSGENISLYQYTISSNTLSCIYEIKSNYNNTRFYVQCNDRYVTFVYFDNEYNDDIKMIICDYIDMTIIDKVPEGSINGYILNEQNIYYNLDGTIYNFSIVEKETIKLCKLDYEYMSYMRYSRDDENALIDNGNLITWQMNESDSMAEGMDIIVIDIVTGKKNKYTIQDTCGLMGIYQNGYIYYIRCNSRDSLCRYSLETKKTEEIVNQTDCAWSSVSGFLKKTTRYYINREDVKLHVIGDYLYYSAGRFCEKGNIMRVELNNDFLLSEL